MPVVSLKVEIELNIVGISPPEMKMNLKMALMEKIIVLLY
jgi:hypothetical protein